MSSNRVKIVECPRDAWQGLPHRIPTARKAEYLNALMATGFQSLDAVSFVAPKRVPQMADSEEVLRLLDLSREVEIIGIVVNEKGAERALNTGKVSTIGYPHSISNEFLTRNQNQSVEGSLRLLKKIRQLAKNKLMVAYVSMAFGNPYGEAWSIAQLLDACAALSEAGVDAISLADTSGVASAQQIASGFSAVREKLGGVELGVHLHSRADEAAERVDAAYNAGCRRFDSVIGGIGGCPFAQDKLVGNIATELVLKRLKALGAELPNIELTPLILRVANQIASQHELPGYSRTNATFEVN